MSKRSVTNSSFAADWDRMEAQQWHTVEDRGQAKLSTDKQVRQPPVNQPTNHPLMIIISEPASWLPFKMGCAEDGGFGGGDPLILHSSSSDRVRQRIHKDDSLINSLSHVVD